MDLVNLQFDLLTSMTTAPLRMLSMIGFAVALAGTLLGVVLLVLRLVYGSAWGGDGVLPLLALLFVFIGGQFVGMGLLGEYLGRVYVDVRGRPRFFVQEVLDRSPPLERATPDQPGAGRR